MSYTIIDLQLAFSPLTRQFLLDSLRQALIHDGFFVVKNYEDYLDPKIIETISQYNSQFFQLSQILKDRIKIKKSRHFRGYYNNDLPKSIKSSRLDDAFPSLSPDCASKKSSSKNQFDEEVIFGIDIHPASHLLSTSGRGDYLDEPTNDTEIYGMLRGPNQWPSSRSLPGLENAVNDYMKAMNEFSYKLVDELVTEALGAPKNSNIFDYVFDESLTQSCHKLKFTKLVPPNTTQLDSSSSSSSKPVSSTINHDSGALLTFVSLVEQGSFTPVAIKSDNSRIKLQELPSGSFVVLASQYLQVLTHGYCTSATMEFDSLQSTGNLETNTDVDTDADTDNDDDDDDDIVLVKEVCKPLHPVYYSTFSQCISVDFMIANFSLPRCISSRVRSIQRERLQKQKQLQQQQQQEHRMTFSEPTDDIFKHFGMSIFLNFARKHTQTTMSWYPRLASKVLGMMPYTEKTINDKGYTKQDLEKAKLKDKLDHLYNVFVSIDASIMLHSISSVTAISLTTLQNRVAQQSQLLADLVTIRQINSVWPDAFFLEKSPIEKNNYTVQFPITASSTTEVTAPSETPRSPQKRKQVFKQKCKDWLDRAFSSSSSLDDNLRTSIPLAPLPESHSNSDNLFGHHSAAHAKLEEALHQQRKTQQRKPVCLSRPTSPTKPHVPGGFGMPIAATHSLSFPGYSNNDETTTSSFSLSSNSSSGNSGSSNSVMPARSTTNRIARSVPSTPRSKQLAAANSSALLLSPSGASLLERIKAKEEAKKNEFRMKMENMFPSIETQNQRGIAIGGSSTTNSVASSPFGTPQKRRYNSSSDSESEDNYHYMSSSSSSPQRQGSSQSDAADLNSSRSRQLTPYEIYIEAKLPSVASILIGLRNSGSSVAILSLEHTLKVIKDSVRITISSEEANDAIHMLATRVPELVCLTKSGTITSVRIYGGISIEQVKRKLLSGEPLLKSPKKEITTTTTTTTIKKRARRYSSISEEEEEEEEDKEQNNHNDSLLLTPPTTPTKQDEDEMMMKKMMMRSTKRVCVTTGGKRMKLMSTNNVSTTNPIISTPKLLSKTSTRISGFATNTTTTRKQSSSQEGRHILSPTLSLSKEITGKSGSIMSLDSAFPILR